MTKEGVVLILFSCYYNITMRVTYITIIMVETRQELYNYNYDSLLFAGCLRVHVLTCTYVGVCDTL